MWKVKSMQYKRYDSGESKVESVEAQFEELVEALRFSEVMLKNVKNVTVKIEEVNSEA